MDNLEQELARPEELVDFLNHTFRNENEKIGTRVQAATSLMQWWFMVEIGQLVHERFDQPKFPSETIYAPGDVPLDVPLPDEEL